MNWGQQFFAAIVSFILAAILGPKAFGTVAMAAVYVLFIQLFIEQGLSVALIQRKELAAEHLDSVFWLTIGNSLLLTSLSVAFSDWWAYANHLPDLAAITRVLSISIPIRALTVVQQAVLQRAMDFKSLAIRTNVSVIIGGSVGVISVFMGAGIWALVAQQITTSCIELVVLWRLSAWRPRFRFSWSHTKELLGFAAGCFLARLGAFVNGKCDALLMGLFFGPTSVGLYRFADRLLDMTLLATTRPLTAVSLPHFSSAQDDRAELRKRWLASLRLAVTISVPLLCMLAGLSNQIIGTIGGRWAPASNVLKIQCAVGVLQTMALFTGPLMQARARSNLLAVMVWIMAGLNMVGLVIAGWLAHNQPISAQILIVSIIQLSVYALVYAPINLVIAMRITRCRFSELARVAAPAFIAGIIGLAIAQILERCGLPMLGGRYLAPVLSGIPTAATVLGVLCLLDAPLRHTLRYQSWRTIHKCFGRQNAGDPTGSNISSHQLRVPIASVATGSVKGN